MSKPFVLLKSIAAVNDAAVIELDNRMGSSVAFQFVDPGGPAFTGTVQFEATLDGVTWISVWAQAVAAAPGTGVTNITAAGVWRIDARGFQQVRARASAASAGKLLTYGGPVYG